MSDQITVVRFAETLRAFEHEISPPEAPPPSIFRGQPMLLSTAANFILKFNEGSQFLTCLSSEISFEGRQHRAPFVNCQMIFFTREKLLKFPYLPLAVEEHG